MGNHYIFNRDGDESKTESYTDNVQKNNFKDYRKKQKKNSLLWAGLEWNPIGE